MSKQVPIDDSAVVNGIEDDGVHQITGDVAYKRLAIVNAIFVGHPIAMPGTTGDWVLVDAGIPGSTKLITHTADAHYGPGNPPVAIVLTHGHFDHVGALEELAAMWNVPIYAHELEQPYLNGTLSYPPPDPSVGGGLMSLSSPLYPRGPIDVSRWLQPLPADGGVPGMPEWRWIPTPGHSPGHVSLWRQRDRTLIAGDAFITTKQESAYAVATQRPELHGPPMYFTPDWDSARDSVRRLAALQPELVVTGHGRALGGEEMRRALDTLARDFDDVAVPRHGKYVDAPHTDEARG
jgi:glyoxylase-like metal-dependent hydrolase (beta-lactamase superfamily II)